MFVTLMKQRWQAIDERKAAEQTGTIGDMRKSFDDKDIDAVVICSEHWHALATIRACQAGNVYVKKISHSIF